MNLVDSSADSLARVGLQSQCKQEQTLWHAGRAGEPQLVASAWACSSSGVLMSLWGRM